MCLQQTLWLPNFLQPVQTVSNMGMKTQVSPLYTPKSHSFLVWYDRNLNTCSQVAASEGHMSSSLPQAS